MKFDFFVTDENAWGNNNNNTRLKEHNANVDGHYEYNNKITAA